jgi:predicted HTH domain antitoxin
MRITLELPDDIAQGLEAQVKNLPRALLESFALEGYRSGTLTEEQVRRILGYGTRMQVHAFLKEHGVYLNYGLEDMEQDMETLRQLRERESARG